MPAVRGGVRRHGGAVGGARVSGVPAVVTQPPLADSPLLNAADVKGGLAVIQRGVVPDSVSVMIARIPKRLAV